MCAGLAAAGRTRFEVHDRTGRPGYHGAVPAICGFAPAEYEHCSEDLLRSDGHHPVASSQTVL